MRWWLEVSVVPKSGVNGRNGEAGVGGPRSLGIAEAGRIRAGGLFMIELRANGEASAMARAEAPAERLLPMPLVKRFAAGWVEDAE